MRPPTFGAGEQAWVGRMTAIRIRRAETEGATSSETVAASIERRQTGVKLNDVCYNLYYEMACTPLALRRDTGPSGGRARRAGRAGRARSGARPLLRRAADRGAAH